MDEALSPDPTLALRYVMQRMVLADDAAQARRGDEAERGALVAEVQVMQARLQELSQFAAQVEQAARETARMEMAKNDESMFLKYFFRFDLGARRGVLRRDPCRTQHKVRGGGAAALHSRRCAGNGKATAALCCRCAHHSQWAHARVPLHDTAALPRGQRARRPVLCLGARGGHGPQRGGSGACGRTTAVVRGANALRVPAGPHRAAPRALGRE